MDAWSGPAVQAALVRLPWAWQCGETAAPPARPHAPCVMHGTHTVLHSARAAPARVGRLYFLSCHTFCQ